MRKKLLKILWIIFIILTIFIFLDKTKNTKFTLETEYSLKDYNIPLNLKIIETKKEYDFKIMFLIILIFIIFFIFKFWWYIKIYFSKKNENKKENQNKIPRLLSDKSINNKEKDIFWTYEKSNNFAKVVYNYWEKEGYVFWLIANWWEWKTTFLNFFRQNEDIKNNCIIFDFNPWYFSDEADLLNKFLNQFKDKIWDYDLSEEFSNLIDFLQENTKTIFWLNFNLFEEKKDLFEIKNSINNKLEKIDKKIIVIIDDLDRISNQKIRIIFKIIDLCRDFYNTNFIICYDPNNFNYIDENLIIEKNISNNNIEIKSQEIDNSNYIDYISKIINIEYHLFNKFEDIKNEFKSIFLNSDLFSEESKKWIKNWIDKLFTNENFRIWWNYIWNLRQIKRLYNNFIVYKNSEISWDIESLFDYEKWLDFSIYVKLRLLLLYYPKLYKNIYNEYFLDNNSDYFIFNLYEYENIYKLNYDYSQRKYFANKKYFDYLEALTVEEREVIQNIFNYEKWKEMEYFNFKDYLNIVDINSNFRFERFKSNITKELIENPKNVKEIFFKMKEEYWLEWLNSFITSFADDEYYYKEHVIEIINYMLDNFSEYSINWLNNSSWYIILNLLEKSSKWWEWIDYIYDLFYWKNDFKNNWIIKKLFDEKWWIVWLYVVSSIVSSLNNDKNYYFNLFEVLCEKEELNKSTKFYVSKIYRYIFKFFKENYIDEKVNIFEKIFSLKKEFLEIKENWKNNIFSYNEEGLLEFIIYQFSVNIWFFDYYEDEKKFLEFENQNFWIRDKLNDYYFKICFSWDWIKYFLKYLFLFKHNKNRATDEKFYDFKYLFEVFNQEKFDNFIEKEKDTIESFVINNENMKKRWEDFLLKYDEFKKAKKD